jgi:hypothetical protein
MCNALALSTYPQVPHVRHAPDVEAASVLVKIAGGTGSQDGARGLSGLRKAERRLSTRRTRGVFLQGCFCACAVDVRFLSVGDVTAARSAARERSRKPAATGKGKLGDAIKRLPVVVPCMLNEIVATVLDGSTTRWIMV